MMVVVVKSNQNGNEFATNGPLCFDHNKHKRPPQPQWIQGGTLCVCMCVYIKCLSDDRSKEKLSWKWYQNFRKNRIINYDMTIKDQRYDTTVMPKKVNSDNKNTTKKIHFWHSATHTHTQRDINTYYLYKSGPVSQV